MKTIILLSLLLISAPVLAEKDWLGFDTNNHVLGIATGVMIVADWGTTLDIERNYENGYFETNKVMGKYPSRGVINRYFIQKLALHTLVNLCPLSQKWKNIWNGYQFIVSYNAVEHNYNAGLKVNF